MKVIASLLINVLFLVNSFAAIGPSDNSYEKDWSSQAICQKDTRLKQNYCLELLKYKKGPQPSKEIILLVPGIFQSAREFDIHPAQGVSLARYLTKKYQAQVYMVNIRGVGKSDYIPHSTLDDIIIDDIPFAIQSVFNQTNKKVLVVAHSQGAITAQTSLAGLSRCGPGNHCFRKSAAFRRQENVKGLVLLAGNAAMTVNNKTNILKYAAKLARSRKLQELFLRMDIISVRDIIRSEQGSKILKFINGLIDMTNVDPEVRFMLYHTSFDATTGPILLQYAQGIENRDLASINGHSYSDNARYITKIPVAQQTYEHDILAEYEATRMDSFSKIGTSQKYFEMLEGHGHSDVMLNKNFHYKIDTLMDFVLAQ